MRFWLTKNSELSVREQLVRQVMLGILSEDLPAGQKLPSVRALARRHGIHANTVSAAYHDLQERGWLELRRGSGLYVRARGSSDGEGTLDRLVVALLESARAQGYEPETVLHKLEHLVRGRTYEQIVIAEPDEAMREILLAELNEHFGDRVKVIDTRNLAILAADGARTVVVALPTRVASIGRSLPADVFCLPLRVRSVGGTLEGQAKPGSDTIVAIVSGSVEIRHSARAMLISVGVDPVSLCEIDTADSDWNERIGRGAVVISDVVAARKLSGEPAAKVFRVVADSSIAELKQLCGG